MAKKNRDLFEVLGAKRTTGAHGSSPADTGGRRAAKAAPAASQSAGQAAGERQPGVGERGRNMLGRLQAFFVPEAPGDTPAAPKTQQNRPRRARPANAVARHTAPALPSRSGIVIAGIAFACLGLGFAIGRLSEGQANPGQDLSVRKPAADEDSFGVRPEAFGATSLPPLTDQELTERLSTHGFVLVRFDIPQSAGGEQDAFERAKPFVGWMREQGFAKVRLRKAPIGSSSAWAWTVVVFVDDPADTSIRERLLALDPPVQGERFRLYLGQQPRPIPIP